MKGKEKIFDDANRGYQWGIQDPFLNPELPRNPHPSPAFMPSDQRLASERIERLAELAREAAKAGDPQQAKRYVRRARRIAERHRLSLPQTFKRFTCGACDRYLVPGWNARVRTQNGIVVITCECGDISRFRYE